MRLFVAVSPGAEVVRRVASQITAMRPVAPQAKWVGVDGIHVTLAFLGERPAEMVPGICEALNQVGKATVPFELRVTGGGAFGRPSRPRVLWAGCEGDLEALSALQRAVSEALLPFGYLPESRPFTAHLTLARAREQGGDLGLGKCAQALQGVEFGATRIDEVILYESKLTPRGAEYVAAHRALLSG